MDMEKAKGKTQLMVKLELRRRTEQELLDLQRTLKPRVDRCQALHAKMKAQLALKHDEQAEAYAHRLNGHKPLVLKLLRSIEQLELKLKAMG